MSHAYTVLGRTQHFAGPMFRVLSDDVAMPGGRTGRRDYIVHIGAVGVVALDEAGRVVLVRQYRHPVGRELWELPAGLADLHGETLLETAVRELAEEADLRAARWDLLADVHTSPGYSTEIIRLFLARDLSDVPAGQRHTREDEEAGITIRRVDLDEAVGMALDGEITNAACLVGVLATAQVRARGWPPLRKVDEPLPG